MKYHKYAKTQMMHETRDIFRGGSTASLAQGSLKCLHELICVHKLEYSPVSSFVSHEGERWLASHVECATCASAGCNYSRTFIHSSTKDPDDIKIL